jgi:HPt (histidine-containing phosphotransfer) domain-containing protein
MTARAAANDRERCLASGMDDYVAKPVSKEKLSLAIGRLCEIPARSPANTSPSHPPESDFCNERLLEQLDGDEDLLVRVMEIFRESTPELIERLREEQAAGDAAGLARTAHTLRGTLSNILAVRASLLAEEIEELARKESLDGLDGRILNLSCEFDTILAELGRFKPSHPATALV